jgi:hypothetical protein
MASHNTQSIGRDTSGVVTTVGYEFWDSEDTISVELNPARKNATQRPVVQDVTLEPAAFRCRFFRRHVRRSDVNHDA